MNALEPASLLSLPGAAFADNARAFWIEDGAGMRLRAAYVPAAAPIGSVVLSPGRTEPIEKYVEVIGELTQRGYSVLAHDWRGQGRSHRLHGDRLRCHAAGFGAQVADFRRLLDRFETQLPAPRLALSHSMGACLTLAALAAGEHRLAGAVLSAPMLALNTGGPPAWLAQALARVMVWAGHGHRYVLSGAVDPLTARFEGNRLTHDRARFERGQAQLVADPELAVGYVTWGWLDSAYGSMRGLARAPRLDALALPVTLIAAADDRIVLNAAIARMADRLPHGRYVEIAGAFHELMMETDEIRAQFWAEFDRLAGSIAPQGPAAARPGRG
jgi:lysophospholipase